MPLDLQIPGRRAHLFVVLFPDIARAGPARNQTLMKSNFLTLTVLSMMLQS